MLKLDGAVLLCTLWQVLGINLQRELQTPAQAMQRLQDKKAKATCAAEAGGFAMPANGISSQLRSGGKVFFIGDDVVGDLCEKGKPGMCCSTLRPCKGQPGLRDPRTGRASFEISLESQYPGWTKLRQYELRSRSETPMPDTAGYIMVPTIPSNSSQVRDTIARIASFLEKMGAGANDVMVVGLLGRQSTHSLAVYDAFTSGLIKHVVNPFAGRAVLLSASPSHPSMASPSPSRYPEALGQGSGSCLPAELPGQKDPPINSFQNAIFVFNVWAELINTRARLVDLHDMLLSMGQCHRDTECRTWGDGVVTMMSQLMLNGLEKIKA